MKRYRLRCPYCGSEHQKYEWWLKFKLIFTNIYTLNCNICHKKSVWLHIFHLRHDSTNKEEQIFNKSKIWDDRID